MDYAFTKRRRITGTQEIPNGCELVDTITYAKRHFIHVRTVQRQCKHGQLRAFKVGGKWFVLTSRV